MNTQTNTPDLAAQLRADADEIIRQSIHAVLPDTAVARALAGVDFPGKIYLVAIGKAALQMARAAVDNLPRPVESGIVITKYGHIGGKIPGCQLFEAGHPVPDQNSFSATQAAVKLAKSAKEGDTILFLVSGGGSALFEQPLISGDEMQDITDQLLSSGAGIVEMNTIRKRLSGVKGGRFGLICAPAQVYAIVLSDILGDPLDMIASGPAVPDHSTCEDALRIAEKYQLRLSDAAMDCLHKETPKSLDNVRTIITGSVRELCHAAEQAAQSLGYTPIMLTDQLCCQAREAGSMLASILKTHVQGNRSLAFIAGGETVVRLTGKGKGGRNQELALGAAEGIAGIENAAVFSVGSDGTDGPTDAAGGYVDGNTCRKLAEAGLSAYDILENNDAFHALEKTGGLIITGPTGTNVNDVAVGLLKAE